MSDRNDAIETAVNVLRRGGLVAVPTETVYGLAADARSRSAVARVFAVKGRPVTHPLIVHVADSDQLQDWASSVSSEALLLAAAFWPGPLTLILPARASIDSGVTGGLSTIALRVPHHPLTLELLGRFPNGIAAPSANRFGRVSPTTAEHVRRDLGEDVDYVLDGGPCTVGLESTVLDLSADVPAILRPGAISREQLEAVLGTTVHATAHGPVKSPGQLPSHYAPRAKVQLVRPEAIAATLADLQAQGLRAELLFEPETQSIVMAKELYSRLRQLDRTGCDVIVAFYPEATGIGLAIRDRLERAAAPRS